MAHLLAATLLWAFSFGLIKGQLTGLDPVLVAAGRLALAVAVFAPFWGRSNLPGSLVRRAMAVGAVQFGGMYIMYIASFAYLPAWLVALLTVFTPLYVILFADFAARRFNLRHVLAALAAVAGAAIVVRANPSGADWRGVMLLQGANVCFALGQWRYRSLQKSAQGRDTALVGWMYLGGLLITALVWSLRMGVGWSSWQPAVWQPAAVMALLYLGVMPTGVGFYLWNRGAARTSPGRLAVSNNLKVPLAVLVSWLVFGETVPVGWVVLGLGIILAGLLWSEPRHR